MDWTEAAVGAGGGLLAVLMQWLVGRTETAAKRRDDNIRRLITEETAVRLVRIESSVDAVRSSVSANDEKLDRIESLLLSGRIPISRKE